MILRETIREGDRVIDATAGNGHDTVFLAECVGENGRVLAFDVQEQAIRSAGNAVAAAGFGERVEFHQRSHARMEDHAARASIAAVMFNLGYLPGEDHGITTQTGETIAALAAAANLLKPGGVLSVVCYPGHAEGAEEAARVEEWISSQAVFGWRCAKYSLFGTLRPAPILLIGYKP